MLLDRLDESISEPAARGSIVVVVVNNVEQMSRHSFDQIAHRLGLGFMAGTVVDSEANCVVGGVALASNLASTCCA